jgi:hypothetical protein
MSDAEKLPESPKWGSSKRASTLCRQIHLMYARNEDAIFAPHPM